MMTHNPASLAVALAALGVATLWPDFTREVVEVLSSWLP